MFTDFVLNGQGHGEAGELLSGVRFETGLLRPYLKHQGGRNVPYVTINSGEMRFNNQTGRYEPKYVEVSLHDLAKRGIYSPVANATSMRKEEWINLDRAVVRATRQRLRFVADLEAAVPLGGFNGMAKLTHEYESMTDPGEAIVDMDGLSDGRSDSPLFKLRSVPLAITHSDFWISHRRIAASQASGTPLDTTLGEACGRRVGEAFEKTAIGTQTGLTFGTQSTGITAHDGNSTSYGLTNFTHRVTKTDLTTPDGTNPDSIVQDVIEMRETMYTNGFFGPFMLYNSTSYDQWLDRTHFVGTHAQGLTNGTRNLRSVISEIDGIAGVRRLDYLTSGYQLCLVQMTSDVVQMINAMDVVTVQWESQGGLRRNFKVLGIKVALFKAPYNGTSGVVHGTTS